MAPLRVSLFSQSEEMERLRYASLLVGHTQGLNEDICPLHLPPLKSVLSFLAWLPAMLDTWLNRLNLTPILCIVGLA